MKLPILPDIQIKSPCSEDWDAMHGTAERRFCTKCGHYVHDIWEMNTGEAAALFANRTNRLCVRFEPGADGRPKNRVGPRWYRATSRFLKRGVIAAATLLGVALASTSGCVMGMRRTPQDTSKNPTTQPTASNEIVGPPKPPAAKPRKLLGAA